MNRSIRRFTVLLSAAAIGLGALAAPARAELVGTAQVLPQGERERVKALVARPEVARKLETLGVLQGDAQARIDALTDQEVLALAGRIDALPAGAMSTQEWLLVIIAILLLIIVL
jgi:hypothetical protein